jgi:hypothetical protein
VRYVCKLGVLSFNTSVSGSANSSTGLGPSSQPPQQGQQRTQNTRGSSPNGPGTTTPSSSTPQPSQQQRPAFPWSARRLVLPPPVVLNKPGIVPPTSPSPTPFPRYGHALPSTATATGDLYLFGGLVREVARNDLYLFSTRENAATLLQTGGEIPSARVGHASALVSNVLIVWGGDTKTDPKLKEKQDDGLYLLNLGELRSMLWRRGKTNAPQSVAGMDTCVCAWPWSCWTLWACGDDGWIEIYCVRWAGRRRVLE